MYNSLRFSHLSIRLQTQEPGTRQRHIHCIQFIIIQGDIDVLPSVWFIVPQSNSVTLSRWCVYCCFVLGSIHRFTFHLWRACQLTLNLGSRQLCNLKKWYKAPSIEHHGSLKSHVFTLIFHFSAALNQPSPCTVGERISEEIEGKGCYM